LPRAARRRAEELLEQVGLADRARFLPSALSGGQRQRVAVARALSNEPLVVLADEPTGNLDQNTGRSVLDLLLGVVRSRGATLVMITHEPTVAACCGRRIKIVDGRIVSDSDDA
jgi:putative ABC transport system ATP-binding protein